MQTSNCAVFVFGGVCVRARRSPGQYRAIDLTLFAFIEILFETLIHTAATRWFPGEPYTVSVVPLITAIVLLRWGAWSAIHAVLGGAVLCLLSGATAGQYCIYCAGSLFGLLPLVAIRRFGTEYVTENTTRTIGYGLAVLLCMQLGRALVSLLFRQSLHGRRGPLF